MNKTNHQKILVLDTSSTWTYLGYAETTGKEIITSKQYIFQSSKEKTSWLSDSIHTFLHPVKLGDLDKVAIGEGPGSFTGLRISFSYIRTAAMLLDIPIITFHSSALWHSAICLHKETLLTQLNKNLYTAYDPVKKNLGIKEPGEWIEFFKNNPMENGIIWDAAYLIKENAGKENLKQKKQIDWPKNCKIYKKEPDQNKVMPNFTPLFEKAENWEQALPEYGHTIKLRKKEKK